MNNDVVVLRTCAFQIIKPMIFFYYIYLLSRIVKTIFAPDQQRMLRERVARRGGQRDSILASYTLD